MGAYNVVNRTLMQSGQPEDVSVILANLDAIAAVVNGGIDNTNIAAAPKIDAAKVGTIPPAQLTGYPADATKVLLGDGTWGAAAIAPPIISTILSPNTNNTLIANTAYLNPFQLLVPTPVSQLGVQIATGGATGNLDVGVYYSDDDATFTKLVTKGSITTPATGKQLIALGATSVLTPVVNRRWYFAIACSSATPAFACQNQVQLGWSKVTSFPLPNSLTGMSVSALTLQVHQWAQV